MSEVRANLTTRILILEGLIKQCKIALYDEEQRDAIAIIEKESVTVDEKIVASQRLQNLKQQYDKKRRNAEYFNNEITNHFKAQEGKIPDDVQELIISCEDNMYDLIGLLLQVPADKAKVFVGVESGKGRFFADNKQYIFTHMRNGNIKHL